MRGYGLISMVLEYILKSSADKQMADVMKPIKDTLEDYLVNGEYHVTLDDFISSVRESLSIAKGIENGR